MGWIGFDLDATLAEWGEGTSNPLNVLILGQPIPRMVARLQAHLAAGDEVRIFTARIDPSTEEDCLKALTPLTKAQARGVGLRPLAHELATMSASEYWVVYQRCIIQRWSEEHLGVVLPITCTKDFKMWKLYDDRCVQVAPNRGELVEDMVRDLRLHLREIDEGDVQVRRDLLEGWEP